MPKIKSVSLRKVFNLGNFETVAIEVVADVNENEDYFNVLGELKKDVEDFYKLEMI